MPEFFGMRMSFERSILHNMRARFLSFSLLFSLACSAGTNGGCTDCAALPDVPYPEEASSINEAAAARITQHSLDFFRKNLVSLLSQYLTVVKQGECLIESSAPECPFGQKASEDIAVLDLNKLTTSTGAGDSSEFPIKFRDGCIESTGEEQKTYDNCPVEKRTRMSILYMSMAKLEESFELEWVSESANSDTANSSSGLHVTISNLEMEADLVLALESPDEVDDSDPIAALLNSLSASCWLTSPLGLPALTIPKIDFTMSFRVDAEGKLEPSISVSEVTITEDDQTNSINMQVKPCVATGTNPECQDTLCPTAVGTENICTELCEVGNLLATVLPALTSQIQPVLNQLAQGLATQLQTSLTEGFSNVKLGIETMIDPAALSPLLSDAKPLNVQLKLHNGNLGVRGEENAPGTGLHATLSAGISAQSRAVCAVGDAEIDAELLNSTLPEFGGFLEVPLDQEGNTTFEPYHMAFTVSEAMLTQMGIALYHSGLLCVGVGSQDILDMSGILLDLKFLTALEPELQDIAPAGSPNENAPIHLGLFATKPPIFRLGSGKVIEPPSNVTEAGMSDYLANVVDDALLELVIDDLQINISTLLGDAQARIASIYADIRIPFTAVSDASNGGILQLRQAPKITISNTHQVYNEIARAADLTQFFETLVDLALTLALKDSLKFDLDFSDAISSAFGSDALTLKIADIRRDVTNFQHSFLSIYVTLCSSTETNDPNHVICYEAPAGSATNRVVRTANMESMYEKDAFKAKNGALHRRTTGRLEVPIEDGVYQYRVDGGAWRSQLRIDDGTLTVHHPFLRVPGDHLVEIARINNRGYEAWHTNIPVRIDPFPPTLTHTIKGSTVRFVGTDDIQPNSVYFVKRFVDAAGTQTPWSPTPDKFELDSAAAHFISVEFAAVDATGNQSSPLEFALNKQPPNAATTFNNTHSSVSKSSCHQLPLSLWFVLLMIPWVVRLRPKPKLNG